MPLITGVTIDSFGKFFIENLQINNLSSFSSLNYYVNPQFYNLDPASKFVSGIINQSTIDFGLSVKDPESLNIFNNGSIVSDTFSGINIDVYTTGRQLIGNFLQNTNQTTISVNSSELSAFIRNYTGFANLNDARQFFLDFNTFDLAGNQDTYHVLLNYPQASITGIEINNTNPVIITPLASDFSSLRNIQLYAVLDKDNVPISDDFQQSYSGYYNLNFGYEDTRYLQTFSVPAPAFYDTKLNISLPFNLVAIPEDYFNTGAYYLSSGIKTSYYNTASVPINLENITGYINCTQNAFDKTLDIKAIVKWNAIRSDAPLSFEAYVYEDGDDNNNFVFTCNNTKVEAISSIAYGTGTGIVKSSTDSIYYSGDAPVFSSFGTSGIQWSDHTLFIDNYYSLPIDLYSTDKSLKYVTEVRVPAGQVINPEVYFVYGYNTGTNNFFIYPSGGQYSGSVYTGTYSGYRAISPAGTSLEFTNLGAGSAGDPGLGELVTDVALSSAGVNEIYISDTDDNGFNVADWTPTVLTFIKVAKKTDANTYVLFTVDDILDNGSYYTIEVTEYRSNNRAAIATNDQIYISNVSYGPAIVDYETGILLAKRVTGNADFVYSQFEPSVQFDVKPDKNYDIKVRASYQDGSYSDFSDILRFTSGQIVDAITGVFPNKFVIDGSGLSGYLAKFTDVDTISTGTIYYNATDDLILKSKLSINFDSPSDIFEVHGSAGKVFSVNDDLTNSLLSVNNIAGLPIFEVFANNTIKAGQFGSGDFALTGNKLGIGTGIPATKLHVFDDNDEVQFGKIGNDQIVGGRTGGSFGISTKAASNGNLILTANNDTYLRTGGSNESVYIKNNGNVSIGSTTAANKLTIFTSNQYDGYYLRNSNGVVGTMLGVSATNDDGTVGLYSNTILKTNITANGASYFNGGSVGIGTTSPQFLLDVVNTSTASKLRIGNASGNNGAQLILAGSNTTKNWVIANQQNLSGTLEFTQTTANGGSAIDTTPSMVINSNGNVGIGTTSPLAKLDVRNQVMIGDASIGGAAYQTLSVGGDVRIHGTYRLSFGSASGGYANIGIIGTSTGTITFNTWDGSADQERLRIVNTTGNVGIGTTTPASKLSIAGSSATNFKSLILRNSDGTVGSTVSIDLETSAGTIGDEASMAARISAIRLGSGTTGGLIFSTANSGVLGEAVRIINNGNVGIATTNPSAKLDIRQTSAATGLKVFTNDTTTAYIAQFIGYDNSLGDTTRMVVQAGGSVGIGTTSPAYKLEVASGTSGQQSLVNFRTADSTTANNAGIQIFATPSATATSREAVMALDADGANASGGDYFLIKKRGNSGTTDFEQYSNASMRFGTNFISRATYDMTIANDGNVGIGTTSPITKLQVRDGAITSGTTTSTSGTTMLVGQYIDGNLTVLGTEYSSGGPMLGYGVTPSTSSAGAFLSSTGVNVYRSAYVQDGATHRWYTGAVQTVAFGNAVSVSERMRINIDGNVGIGTTSPDTKLQVDGNIRIPNAGKIVFGSAGTPNDYLELNDVTSPSSLLKLVQDGATRFVIQGQTGNVGVGTTNPATKIHISGGTYISNILGTGDLRIENTDTVGVGVSLKNHTGKYWFIYNGGTSSWAGDGVLGFVYTDGTNAATGPKVVFNSDGNVGIGTTNPSQKLEVVGGEIKAGRVDTGNEGGQVSFGRSTDNATAWYIDVYGNTSTPTLRFIDVSNASIRMVINESGNLGVGTASPSQKLHVEGSIRVTGAYYDSNNQAGTSGQYLSSTGTGTDWIDFTGIDGSGTTNYVAKWVDSNTLTNSIIFDNGTSVGIGTTSPTTLFQLRQTTASHQIFSINRANSATPAIYIGNDSSDNAIIASNNTALRFGKDFTGTFNEYARIDANGNLGIGTSSPSAGVHINNAQGTFSEVLRLQRNSGIFYSIGLDTNFFNIAYNNNSNANNIFVLKTNGFLGLGNLQTANYNLDIASTQAQGIQLRFDTSTNYLARITPYWNSNTDSRIDFAINRSGGATPDVIMSVGYGTNVGIGTTNPASKLTVQGDINVNYDSSATNYVRRTFATSHAVGNRGATLWFSISDGSETGIQIVNTASSNPSYNSQYIAFHTHEGAVSAAERMRITPLGSVGIGTTTPTAKLEIQSNVAAAGSPAASLTFSNVSDGGHRILFKSSTGNLVAIDGDIYSTGGGTDDGVFKISTATNGTLSEKMRINYDGNVGIGTASPSYKLDVVNAGGVTARIYNTTNTNDAYLITQNTLGSAFWGINATGSYIYNFSAIPILFYTTGVEKMRIDANGNVGIGTSSPADKLHVMGNVRINGGDILNWSGQAFIQTLGNYDMFFRPNSTLRMILTSVGNLGIGNGFVNPTAKLHINSSVSGETLIRADGTSGTLFSVVDDLTDSLMSVNNSAGLPVLEVFADDRVIMGQYGQNDLVVRNNKVGIGTNNPSGKLTIVENTNGATINLVGRTSDDTAAINFRATGDTSTYAYISPDTNEFRLYHNDGFMSFYAGGTEKVRIKSDGNVGIGTTNPITKFVVNAGTVNTSTYTSSEARIADGSLHLMKTVAGGIFESIRAMNADTTVGTTVRFIAASTSDPFNNANGGKVFIDAIRTASNMDLAFSLNDVGGAAPVERVRFMGGGNVGIGTTSAVGKLHIEGTYPQLVLNNPSAGSGCVIQLKDNGTNRGAIGHFTLTSALQFSSAGLTPQMTLDSNGNVGIGTTTPSKLLHVAGDMVVATTSRSGTIFFGTDGGTETYIRRDNNYDLTIAQNDASGNGLYLAGAGNVYISIDSNNNGTTDAFIVQNNSIKSGTELFRVQENGNVGIGTSSPGGKLEIITGGSNLTTYDFGWDLKTSASGGWARSHRIYNTNYTAGTTFFGVFGGASSVNYAYWTYGNPSSVDTTGYNTSNGIFLIPSGSVGIGTTSPTAKLQVVNTERILGILRVESTTRTTFYDNAFAVANDGGGATGFVYTSGTGGLFPLDYYGELILQAGPRTGYNNGISLVTGTTSPSVKLRIAENGNVGIGTTSPTAKLDLVDAGNFFVSRDANGYPRFSVTNGSAQLGLFRSGTSAGGFYIGGDDTLFSVWTTGFSRLVNVNNSGNLGIGTTTINYPLDIYRSGNSFVQTYGTNEAGYFARGNGGYLTISTNATTARFGFSTSAYNSATDHLVINANGNIGIGTSSPLVKLHISNVVIPPAAAAITSECKLVISGVDGTIDLLSQDDNSTVSNVIGMGRYNASTGSLIHKFGIVSWANTGSTGSNTGDRIGFHYGTNTEVYNSTELFSIRGNGNVGIGTSVPTGRLHIYVNGSSIWSQILQTPSAVIKRNSIGFFDNGNANIASIITDVNANNTADFGISVPNGSPRLTIKSTGNVGIGTTSPAAKLDVAGDIQAEAILGKSYSASGGATIDTGITADTFTVLEVVGYANPNSGGSAAYKDPIHIFIYNGAGWNGSALTQYIYSNQLAPLAREIYTSGSSSSANVIDVVWLTGSTESDSCPAATASSYQVRLKISNYNVANGSYFNVRIMKRY